METSRRTPPEAMYFGDWTHYSDAVAAFFHATPAGARPQPPQDASPARRLRDALEPIAMHPVWSATTNERLAGLGLDFLSGYVCGRAAALGEPDPGVVVAAFAVFEPSMIRSVFHEGRRACRRDKLIAARTESTVASLNGVLGGTDVSTLADVLHSALTSADATGRPLFSGLLGQPSPADPVGRLWRACDLAREHRGDSYVAVCVAAGLGPIEMNILTELWVGMPLGSYTATRGWPADAIVRAADGLRAVGWLDGAELSPEGRTFRTELETSTDVLEQPIVDALAADLEVVIERLADLSARCIAGTFPPDAYKRAAG